jgi:hypothetical protein
LKENAFTGYAIKVGGVDKLVEGVGAFKGAIGTGVASPIVGKGKNDVGLHLIGLGCSHDMCAF